MLVNMSNTMAALNGEMEQKFSSTHVSSKSGAWRLHLNRPCDGAGTHFPLGRVKFFAVTLIILGRSVTSTSPGRKLAACPARSLFEKCNF